MAPARSTAAGAGSMVGRALTWRARQPRGKPEKPRGSGIGEKRLHQWPVFHGKRLVALLLRAFGCIELGMRCLAGPLLPGVQLRLADGVETPVAPVEPVRGLPQVV